MNSKNNFILVENNDDLYPYFEELYLNQDYTCHDIKKMLNIGNSKYQSLVNMFFLKNGLRRTRGAGKSWLCIKNSFPDKPTIKQYNGVEED